MKKLLDAKGLTHSTSLILLDNIDTCYYIESGGVDLFLGSKTPEGILGSKVHVLHLNEGQVACAVDFVNDEHKILCLVPLPNTKLYSFKTSLLEQRISEKSPEIINLLNQWLLKFSSALLVNKPLYEVNDLKLSEDHENAEAGEFYKNSSNNPICVKIISGKLLYQEGVSLVSGQNFVIAPGAYFQTISECELLVTQLNFTIEDAGFMFKLKQIHDIILQNIMNTLGTSVKKENIRLKRQQKNQNQQLGYGLKLLTQVFNKKQTSKYDIDEPSLLLACRVITDKEGIPFEASVVPADDNKLTLRDVEHQNVFRNREVILKDNWWNCDQGSLLAFHVDDDRPIALTPDGPKKYQAFDTKTKEFFAVDDVFAKHLKSSAYFFYRPMEDKPYNLRELMKFGMRNSKRDMWVTLFISFLAALLGMVTPIAMSLLIDNVIPEANYNQLFFIGSGLVAIAIANATFSITRGIAMQRFQGKNNMAIQTAVWDRLLALPVPFFQKYSSGELANRANGITSIMNILSGTTSTALISGIFSVFYFLLLFYYDSKLAWIATGIAVVTIIATVIVNYIKLGYIRKETTLNNKMSGLVLQLLEGVSKLRNTGAEARAFFQWSKLFSEQRPQIYKAENVSNYLETYNAILPLISSILIFWGVIYFGQGSDSTLTTGQFIAFNVAYGSFLAGMIGLTEAAMSILAIVPIYENSKPILTAIPERSLTKQQVPQLNGKIEVNNIRFRYEDDGPEILKGLSITVKKGEYVALVGGSGSGKSTLLRILLGFEEPETGSVFYDDLEMGSLDVTSLRRQLGVVLQNGSLMMGDIFKNIVGSASLTLDDAWAAARMCGLEGDIEAMPMGMNTMITSGVLSGGQIQRLMIARAIVHKPNILFFDEATSALDNRTQAVVTKSLESLSVTRIVIAHRLSTIINADRILYLHNGKIVEDGTYEELMAKDGYFSEIAKRQSL